MSRKSREMASQVAAQANSAAQSAQSVQSESSAEPALEPSTSPEVRVEAPIPRLRNEPRRLAMEEIEQRELRQKAGDRPAPTVASEEPAPVTEPAPEPVPVAEPGAEPAAEPAPQPVPMVKVKVDGQEFEVPQSEIDEAGSVAAYQRERAAENRLEKANRALAETRQLQALIAQHAQATMTPPKPQLTPAQFIAERMEKVRFGTEEESATAMQEILQFQQPNIEAITQNAVTTMQKNMAVDNFKKEFQDIVANPLLLQLASTLENQRAARLGPNTDWNAFFRGIGNEVRSVTGMSRGTSAAIGQSQSTAAQPGVAALAAATAQQATDQTSQAPSEREARKASITNLPTAAARAAMPETKPETREDILNQMRKSRGIPVG